MSDTNPAIDVGEIDPKTGRPKLSWTRDVEIWAPCRLGEAFTLREFGHESTQYLYSMSADWMGQHGDGACVRSKEQLEGEYQHPIRVGIGPRPWACCWTYEPKIKITPPVWCWEMQDDTMFGLELKPKRNGSRRKAKLDCVMIHKGRPVYCIVVETSDGESRRYYDSIPVLDPYFAPIWPATAEETPEVAEPTPEPVGDPVAKSRKLYDGGDFLSASDWTKAKADQLRRVLTTSNAADLVADCLAQADPDTPTSWTGTENRPPGVCIGGRTPFNGKYYYYVWFEDPPTEGETYEQKAGP